jgi:hypothetical protein
VDAASDLESEEESDSEDERQKARNMRTRIQALGVREKNEVRFSAYWAPSIVFLSHLLYVMVCYTL